MVAKITTGKAIRGLLHYNENKMQQQVAKLIHAQGFMGRVDEMTLAQKLYRFQKLTNLNRRTKTNAVHISLNFSQKDKLDDDKLKYIAQTYMERIGFGKQPFLVYRHDDANHPHIHIVTTNIAQTGKRIETHNLGKTLSETARKALEVELNLVVAEEQKSSQLIYQPLEKASYGKAETKALISNIVTEVMRTYHFESFAGFKAVLAQFNIDASLVIRKGDSMHKNGLVYNILDSRGKKVSLPIKSSSIYNKPTFDRISKKALFNKKNKSDASLKLVKANLMERIMVVKTTNNCKQIGLVAFQELLKKKGVFLHLIFNESGRLYGCTYVDNLQRSVFKGSELGKDFTAQAINNAFELVGVNEENLNATSLKEKSNSSKAFDQKSTGVSNNNENFMIENSVSVFESAFEILGPDYHTKNEFDAGNLKKKRKKKKR
ncbi:relaxase/mobilization nuclease domain-containing protein [Belliella aquatica]|uniref:Relaxase n=1 Tax=Belliella aquatica TaxID=1323734 RepID=A0ABQ1MIF5_9BACT|nr:relaxase/mobilization nuclease domain-containing protein [Belliella aquatica]MCH7406333.1 relaxase/mobilization nuclease domain-containing protein [Belliella aquatica]GGC37913.1 relaxase [Belliella aquatica]